MTAGDSPNDGLDGAKGPLILDRSEPGTATFSLLLRCRLGRLQISQVCRGENPSAHWSARTSINRTWILIGRRSCLLGKEGGTCFPEGGLCIERKTKFNAIGFKLDCLNVL